MEGISILSDIKEPLRSIPEDPKGLTICLKFVGGIGDAIIGIGSVAYYLRNKNCKIIACTMPHQKDLILNMEGVDEWIKPQSIHRPEVLGGFDVLIDFAGTLNNTKELLAEDYYSLIEKKVGFDIVPGKFTFKTLQENKIIALHPGASNPNRRWIDNKWKELAYELAERGFGVTWLGTKDEYGFSDRSISKLSNLNDDLLWQARTLSNCTLFVGTDSAFAHIAGVLGIKGAVLFGNTSPEHVIARYPKLKGISAYNRLGLKPTRRLNFDEMSVRCMEAIEVQDVLDAIDCISIPKRRMIRDPQKPFRWKISIVSKSDFGKQLKIFLDSFYKVELSKKQIEGKFDCTIIENEKEFSLITDKKTARIVKRSNFESIRRAIREILKDYT